MKMKQKPTKQLLSWIYDQFFLNEYIRRSSVAKDTKTNILVFCAERIKEWYCNQSEILEPNATENVDNCLRTLKTKTE